MRRDKVGIVLDVLGKVVTIVGWALIVLGLFFFSMPEKGFF